MSETTVFTSRRFQREFTAARAAADAGAVVEVSAGKHRYTFQRTQSEERQPPAELSPLGRKAWALAEKARLAGLELWDDDRVRREVRGRRGGADARGEA